MPSQEKTAQQRKEASHAILYSQNIKVNEGLPLIEENIKIRTKKEIVDRAIALCLISVYAEGVCTDIPIDKIHSFIHPMIEKYQAESFFTEAETAFMQMQQPTKHEAIQFSWKYECYHVLLWTLGFLLHLGKPNEICDVGNIVKILKTHDNYDLFFHAATLRNREEILDEADLIYRYDWACVDARIHGFQIEEINSSIVMERHRALNWIINYMNQDWDHVTLDT